MRILAYMLITPIAVACMLDVIIQIGKVLHNTGHTDWPIVDIEAVSHCNNGYYYDSRYEEPCLSVGYSIIGDSNDINDPKYERYHDLMKIFTKNNGDFKYG
jgi:hypothetical protein